MKLLIASDIHGSAYWCSRLMEAVKRENPDKVILLGDLLYHGPRNDLPRDYAPKQVISMLNNLYHERGILAVRGNCDAEVDQMVLDFPIMADYTIVMDGTRELFCTHGHIQTPECHMPIAAGGAFLSGHTHIKTCKRGDDGVWYINPGSVSLPKDGSNSYAVYEDGKFKLNELQ